MPPFQVWDSATNTELVTRSLETINEQEPPIGASIAPLVSVTDRRIKRGTMDIAAFGKGQFKARNATPPLFTPTITFTEEYIELALLEEMTEIEEDEWHDLTGDNEYARDRAGVAILARARILQLRNERLTEWMRWQAFKDALVVDVGGQDYEITYGIPSDQLATVTPAWDSSPTTSTPIASLRALQKLLYSRVGRWGLNIYMSTNTWESMQYAKEIADLLKNNSNGDFMIPSIAQVESLLYGGDMNRDRRPSDAVTVTVTDAGFRDVGATGRGFEDMTLYIPDGYVLITTPAVVDGEKIADVADGRVAVTTNGGPPLVWRQGAQSETMYDLMAKTHFWRQASARMVRINVPGAFVYAHTWA